MTQTAISAAASGPARTSRHPLAVVPARPRPTTSLEEVTAQLRAHVEWSDTGGTSVLDVLRDVVRELPAAAGESECVTRLSRLEDIKSAVSAAQVRETVAFHRARLDRETAEGVPASRRGKGLGGEIALARRESPSAGSRFLGMARLLDADMPHALGALTRGEMSEFAATMLVREVITLPSPACQVVDERLSCEYGNLGIRALTARARAYGYQADPRSALARHEIARSERRVTVRAAADGMSYFTALIPTTQAFTCKKSLMMAAATAHSTGNAPFTYGPPTAHSTTRSRSGAQTEADILVERLTGQPSPEAIPVELTVVMTDESLFGVSRAHVRTAISTQHDIEPDTRPGIVIDDDGTTVHPSQAAAWVPSLGPLPATMARDLLDPRHDSPHGTPGSRERVFLRRVLLDPVTGDIAKLDTRKRAFTGTLRRALLLRDDVCRTPGCGAPIVHLDHASPFASGGDTNAANGTGLCARCNYTKELPGWHHSRDPNTGTLTVTTPTGHQHDSRPSPIVPRL